MTRRTRHREGVKAEEVESAETPRRNGLGSGSQQRLFHHPRDTWPRLEIFLGCFGLSFCRGVGDAPGGQWVEDCAG